MSSRALLSFGRAQTDESRGQEENRLDHGLGNTKVLVAKAIHRPRYTKVWVTPSFNGLSHLGLA